MKTIKITDKQYNFILEGHNDLNIPFAEYGDERNGYKLMYEQYMDYIETIGHYGTLPASKEYPYDVINNIVSNMDPSDCMEYDDRCYAIQWLYNRKEKDCFKDYDNIQNIGEIDVWDMTPEGKRKVIEYGMDGYDFPNGLTVNDKNQIYVERVIGVPDIMKPVNIYNHFVNNYDHIGECWSWAEEGASNFGDTNVCHDEKLILKGWVRTEDVNWDLTIAANASAIHFEQELTLNYGAQVEVFEIICDSKKRKGTKLPLKQPIILQA